MLNQETKTKIIIPAEPDRYELINDIEVNGELQFSAHPIIAFELSDQLLYPIYVGQGAFSHEDLLLKAIHDTKTDSCYTVDGLNSVTNLATFKADLTESYELDKNWSK